MKKIALLLPLLVACKIERNPNLAELRVKSDITTAKCASGKLSDGTYVTKCDFTSDAVEGKPAVTTTILAAQGGEYPFQALPFKSNATIKAERKEQEEAQKKAQAERAQPQPQPQAPAPVAPAPLAPIQ